MRRPTRSPLKSGFTLVELMIALGLAVMILAAVATISQQVQRTISSSTQREDAVRYARGVLSDIERDLANLVRVARAPDPFAGRVLEIESNVPHAPAVAANDRLRLFSVVRVPSGALGRGFIEYTLENVAPNPGGGPDVGNVQRSILEYVGPTDSAPTTGGPQSVLANQVVGFKVEWLDDAGVFQAPTSNTSTGQEFSLIGTLDISQDTSDRGTRATATGGDGQLMLNKTPIGGEILLLPDPLGIGTAPVRVLVRRRLGNDVLLSERLQTQDGVGAQRFAGPAMLRVTLTLLFGRGGDAQTARFSRNIAVR
jgi:prepilin-type N-terminal cleavage/methylation domain-containing protein